MVRCCDCGYFSLFSLDDRSLHEMDAEARAAGKYGKFHGIPKCALNVADFAVEMREKGAHETTRVEVGSKERQCTKFVQWQPALSPKEHFIMQFIEEVRAANARRDQVMLNWQAKQERIVGKREDRRRKEDRRWEIKIGVLGFVGGTIFTAIFAWVASMIFSSDAPRQLPPPIVAPASSTPK